MSIKIQNSAKALKTKEFFCENTCNDDKFDIRGVKVLNKTDWDRLQFKLHKNEIELEKRRREQENREKIRQNSHEIIKNWTNTVLGARQKKLEDRQRRLDEEEYERKQVDIAEAQYQAEKRKKAIEEAKTKQYYQTDRVKNFHSALLFSEVLKEREAQIELKRLRELADCRQDDQYVAKMRREYEDALKSDQEKASERIRKSKENSEYLKSQIKYNSTLKEKEVNEWMIEGENIRRLAIANALERQRLDQIEREEQRQLRGDYMQQIEDVRKMRDIERLKDEEDDEEIRIFAAAKKKMIKLRLAKEMEMYNEKQNNLDKIKNKLMAQLKSKMNDEDQRIKNAVAEKEEKFQTDEAEKLRKREEMLKSIDEFRHNTVQRLEEEKRLNRQRDIDTLLVRRDADAVLRAHETKREQSRFSEAKRIAEENLKTSKDRKENDEFSHGNQLRALEENQQLLDMEERIFQEYAKKVIEHSEAGGRNTYPLKLAAMKGVGGGLGPLLPGSSVRPSYKTSDNKCAELPNWQTGASKDIKDTINSNATSDNLGFVWRNVENAET